MRIQPLSQGDWPDVQQRAYLPEQLPGLMTAISGAQAWLAGDYLAYQKEQWAIFTGYPLSSDFQQGECEQAFAAFIEHRKPEVVWFIGPEIPAALQRRAGSRQSDRYYRLDLAKWEPRPSLLREVRRARTVLEVHAARRYATEHERLADELLAHRDLTPLVAALYRRMPAYLSGCDSALVLEARRADGGLAAFFVVDTGAQTFDSYLLGCYSRDPYTPHASDLLFYQMVERARQSGKGAINLGLGVNDGIRRFKTKWGGAPFLNYEYCEHRPPRGALQALLAALMGR